MQCSLLLMLKTMCPMIEPCHTPLSFIVEVSQIRHMPWSGCISFLKIKNKTVFYTFWHILNAYLGFLIAVVSRISHTRTPLPFNKSDWFLSVGECMSHLILSLFKYKLKLMRVDRHIMHWIMLNWTSLNNTYCQTVYNPVEMFISAFLRSWWRLLSVN